MFGFDTASTLIIGGLGLGIAFGALAERSEFCLLSGIRQSLRGETADKLGAFLVAMLVALAGTQALVASDLIKLKDTIFFPATGSLVAVVIGGLLFGLGAVLTRGCAGRLTVLAGTGNLRALMMIILFGFASYATQRGVLAWPRLSLEAVGASTVTATGVSSGMSDGALIAIAGLALAAALFVIAAFRASVRVITGALIGVIVVGGWVVTGILAADEFSDAKLFSLSFTSPLGNGLQYLMTATGAKMDFGIAMIGGMIGGSFLSALAGQRLKLQSFENPRQMLRYISGALLMGFGGVLALGCSMGQGLAGVSTLSILSLTAITAIGLGMIGGLRFVDKIGVSEKPQKSSDDLMLAARAQ
ncbi:MAG: YeeE/YedE family protein [Beijerinckiaceae bacterium]